jgi:hypothetical protein
MRRYSNQIELSGRDLVRLEQAAADNKLPKKRLFNDNGCCFCKDAPAGELCEDCDRELAKHNKKLDEQAILSMEGK